MLKRIRDLLGRRGKRPSLNPASPPEIGEESEPSPHFQSEDPTTASAAARVHRGPSVVHHPIPLQDLDPDAVKILRRLTRFDHTAYLVGGCVRDLLLERKPKDFDIGTSATPRQVKRLFSNCRIIGRRFRLAHIYFQNGKIIEVATFRARDEVEEGDAPPDRDLLIRDDNVFGTPEEDALRRDFTINAMFYDVNAETVIDHAEGLVDLRHKLVRTIGDPGIRFREDPIRILRAIKFAARLGFRIETETLEALKRLRHEIPKAASARVLEEINRFCRGGAARASFDLMRDTDVFDVVLPEFADAYREDAGARELLARLLDAMDARCAEGREPQTAEILATLVLPLVAPAMGWSGDAKGRKAFDMRELADRYVRPMALRLRVSRKDQEGCRQILMVLGRMVPGPGTRRGQRDSLRRRPWFPQALVLLAGASSHYGGDLATSSEFWRETDELLPSTHGQERSPDPTDDASESTGTGDEEPRKRRRRSRRRGRGRGPEAKTARPATTEPLAAAPPKNGDSSRPSNLPPPWDDRYFFAALPTATQVDAGKDVVDRYGAATLASTEGIPAESAESMPAPEGGTTDPAPRPRRSRRRRPRRRGAGNAGSQGTSDSV